MTALNASKEAARKAIRIPIIMHKPKLILKTRDKNEFKIKPRIAQLIKTELVFQNLTPKIINHNPIRIKIAANPCLGIPN